MLRIQITSDTGYERVYAEVYLEDHFICFVSQEESQGQLYVEFPAGEVGNDGASMRKVRLDAFLEVIKAASHRLTVSR
jgi:hypothetical protein